MLRCILALVALLVLSAVASAQGRCYCHYPEESYAYRMRTEPRFREFFPAVRQYDSPIQLNGDFSLRFNPLPAFRQYDVPYQRGYSAQPRNQC